MALPFSYANYVCPCSELTPVLPLSSHPKRSSRQPAPEGSAGDEQAAFNPHDPRANYSLYPLDHFFFCDECSQIRCNKCVSEEIVCWYCPSCLFEVPSSVVKSDGNRCSRNCYNCPICSSTLAITALGQKGDGLLKPGDSGAGGDETYILQCQYCDWSTLDAGIHLSRPTKITEQLNKLRTARRQPRQDKPSDTKDNRSEHFDHGDVYGKLATFYKGQLSESDDPQIPFSNSPYSSPANLARIMSLYGGLSYNALKKSRERPQPMREAAGLNEGFVSYTANDAPHDEQVLQKLRMAGWECTSTASQRLQSGTNYMSRFVDELWPVATPLRTRKSKRCRSCRHIIILQDSKVGSMRYKLRIIALNNIPRLSIRPLQSPTTPLPNSSFILTGDQPYQGPLLLPNVAQQYVLTLRNPIFETVKVTLGTPGTTPGRVASKVTILCPSFTIGPAGDVWDEALGSSMQGPSEGGRKEAMASLTGGSETERQPEAGKPWEKARNMCSVILEIVPGSLKPPPPIVPKTKEELTAEELKEDDDVLEVPVLVRAEWEAERLGHKGGEKEHKEVVYWCVLGVGKISG